MTDFPVSPRPTRTSPPRRAPVRTRLTKPPGSLGRLEDLSVWVSSCQGVCPPRQFERARVVVFAGDHGVAAAGVSAYPAEVTAQMVANFDAGGAAINVLAEAAGATVRVVDIAVDTSEPLTPSIGAHKVRRGSGNIAVEDALTDDEVAAALDAGRRIADEEVDSGADIADRRRYGHRKHHARNDSDRGTDRFRAGRGGRPWHRCRRRGMGPQDRRHQGRAVPGPRGIGRSRCAAADLRWGRSGGDGGILRAGRGAAHAVAARRCGGDGRRVGGRKTRARCPAVVAGRSPLHRTRACAGAAATGPRAHRRPGDAARRGHRRRGRAAHRAGCGGHAGVDGHVRRGRDLRRSPTTGE